MAIHNITQQRRVRPRSDSLGADGRQPQIDIVDKLAEINDKLDQNQQLYYDSPWQAMKQIDTSVRSMCRKWQHEYADSLKATMQQEDMKRKYDATQAYMKQLGQGKQFMDEELARMKKETGKVKQKMGGSVEARNRGGDMDAQGNLFS